MNDQKDTMILTGNVMHPHCNGQSRQSVVVIGNKIEYIGSYAQARAFAGATAIDIDCGEYTLMSGFVEAHIHLGMYAKQIAGMICPTLGQANSAEACARMIASFAQTRQEDDRIVGFGWDINLWQDKTQPDREILDRYIADKPVYLFDSTFHTSWINSAALKETGLVGDETFQIGKVGKRENGELSGLLYELEAGAAAMHLAFSLTDVQKGAKLYKQALKKMAAEGITTVCCMDCVYSDTAFPTWEYEVLKMLEQQGELPVRVFLYPSMGMSGAYDHLRNNFCSELLRVGGVKGFVDGVINEKTAYFHQPFANTQECGLSVFPQEFYNEMVAKANAQGLPVRLHAIGDRAVDVALKAFEYATMSGLTGKIINVIEHGNAMNLADAQRACRANVAFSIQPQHALYHISTYEKMLGEERASRAYPVASLLKEQVCVALGSDAPCVDTNPLLTIDACLTRINKERGVPFGQGEEVSLEQALMAYTEGGAMAAGVFDEFGSLEVGKKADIIVLNCNVLKLGPDEVASATAVLTICNGVMINDARSF